MLKYGVYLCHWTVTASSQWFRNWWTELCLHIYMLKSFAKQMFWIGLYSDIFIFFPLVFPGQALSLCHPYLPTYLLIHQSSYKSRHLSLYKYTYVMRINFVVKNMNLWFFLRLGVVINIQSGLYSETLYFRKSIIFIFIILYYLQILCYFKVIKQ